MVVELKYELVKARSDYHSKIREEVEARERSEAIVLELKNELEKARSKIREEVEARESSEAMVVKLKEKQKKI